MTATTWHRGISIDQLEAKSKAPPASSSALQPYYPHMASTSLCATCRQVFRLRFGRPLDSYKAYTAPSIPSISRPFSTTRLVSSSQATPKEYQPKPPPTKTEPSDSPATPGLSIAKELRKRASSVTETYVAYGVCENLVKECARQADYTIPQAHEKNVDVPKTKGGEDLGVGTGWWFDSTSNPCLLACEPFV